MATGNAGRVRFCQVGVAFFLMFGAVPGIGFANAQGAAPITVVQVQMARLQSQIKLSGTVEARRHSVLSAEVAGLVSELLVDEGDQVVAGDPLLRLRAQPSELMLSFVQAGRRRAEADVKLGRLKEQRQSELLQSQAAAQGSYDLAEAELNRAIADRAAAQASVARAEDDLERHLLKAPFGGVISRKQTELGSWVRPGDPLLELHELAVLRLTAPLPQRYFNLVDEGTEVQLQFHALPGETVSATISRKVTAANPISRTFPLLIDLANPDGRLAPGMSVDITVQLTGGSTEVLQVPVDALVRQADGSVLLWKVIAKAEQLQVVPAPIELGRSHGGFVEITSGPIAAGDRVVEQGNERMRPGLPVRILAEH
ncbi:MAG: efflux RND transporter periplasmic adaptor subunit [Immundisolibacteraceae bacterium]|nr:efflux RND transporter periplasmic adaptor subunit [Immundisolibacteraceae bacterium]